MNQFAAVRTGRLQVTNGYIHRNSLMHSGFASDNRGQTLV
jgi:hypothetical protein